MPVPYSKSLKFLDTKKSRVMEPEEKLRKEIMHLSNLIAASTTNTTCPSTSTNAATTMKQYHSSFSQSSSAVARGRIQTKTTSLKLVKYHNPFDRHYSNDTYLNHVFPTTTERDTSIRETSNYGMCEDTQIISLSKYNMFPEANGSSSSDLNELSRTPPTSVSENSVTELSGSNVETKAKPTSVFINPTYLAKMNSSFPSCVVRPHVNPAHSAFQVITANSSKTPQHHSLVAPSNSSSSSSTSHNYVYNAVQTNISLNTNNCDKERTNPNKTLRTKYKLDRRVKRSPVRKAAKAKFLTPSKPVLTTKAKLFKRFSMRVVPAIKLTTSNWMSSSHRLTQVRKPVAMTKHHLNKKTVNGFIKPRTVFTPSNCSKISRLVKKGSKSIIHIDGNKFVSKNKGKTLKRMNSKENVVSINGNRFIRKNSGKSLKRLSESSDIFKPSHSQHQTTLRLANRAVQRSKLALSQRTWKKKQFCLFYNRFGECKRSNTGSCPYIHDRKQLMICPKFLVGNCTVKNCKLSHDQKIGRMPPCQFFNRSKCSRENCPYPHIKASPLVKKTSETAQGKQEKGKAIHAEGKLCIRKKKLSTKKGNTSPQTRKNKREKEKEPKSRYYEQCPDSQPIVSIIPRRLPKDSNEDKMENGPDIASSEGSGEIPSVSGNSTGDSSTAVLESRRMRIMGRISRLHEKVKKKESPAPQFLAFN